MSYFYTPGTHPHLELYFRGVGPHRLQRALLAQCPRLARMFVGRDHMDFPDMDGYTGRVLIRFLQTGEFAPIRRFINKTHAECLIEMYKTAHNCLVLGRVLDLPLLQAQASERLDWVRSEMRPLSVMEAILDSHFAMRQLAHKRHLINVIVDHVLEETTPREARKYLLNCKLPDSFGKIAVMMVLMEKASGHALLRAGIMLLHVLPAWLSNHRAVWMSEIWIRRLVFLDTGDDHAPMYKVPRLRPRATEPKLKRGKIARAQIGLAKRAGTRNKEKKRAGN